MRRLAVALAAATLLGVVGAGQSSAMTGTPAASTVSSAAVSRADRGEQAASRLPQRNPHRFGSPDYSMWLAKRYMKVAHGWGDEQWQALRSLWWRESNWRYEVSSPTGKFMGLGQKEAANIHYFGYTVSEYRRSPMVQVIVGLKYIRVRHGSPIGAWQHFLRNGWH